MMEVLFRRSSSRISVAIGARDVVAAVARGPPASL